MGLAERATRQQPRISVERAGVRLAGAVREAVAGAGAAVQRAVVMGRVVVVVVVVVECRRQAAESRAELNPSQKVFISRARCSCCCAALTPAD
jgi:hypothetical protein